MERRCARIGFGRRRGHVTLNGAQLFDSVRVINGGVLQVTPYNGAGTTGTLDLVADSVMVDATSRIDGSGGGFGGVVNNPGGGTGGGGLAAAAGGGGGHGGDGDDGLTGDCLTASGSAGAANGVVDTATERGFGRRRPHGLGDRRRLRRRFDPDYRCGHRFPRPNRGRRRRRPGLRRRRGRGRRIGGGITLVTDRLFCTGVLTARGGSGGAGTNGNGGGGGGGRIELYTDSVDESCAVLVNAGRGGCGPVGEDGTVDDVQDHDFDGDGETASTGDCDGANVDIDGNAEVCDGLDNDCDGDVDDPGTCGGFDRANVSGRIDLFETTDTSWTSAQTACTNIGYTLAEIRTPRRTPCSASRPTPHRTTRTG